jgi:hypothetical protein
MHDIHEKDEKGTKVNGIEQSAQSASRTSGLFLTRTARSRCQGVGASAAVPRSRRCRLLVSVLLVSLAAAFVSIAGAASALAAGEAPTLRWVTAVYFQDNSEDALIAFSTRMFAEASIGVDGLNTKWRAEYSTSKSALEDGSGTVASSGEQAGDIAGGGQNIPFGPLIEPKQGPHMVHHLVPGTHYYARFFAENADGTAVLPFEFTTAAVARPEIAQYESGDPVSKGGHTSLEASATGQTTAAFKAEIETNGAATDYSFGYSESPSGPYTTCTSGSISIAEDYAWPEFHCNGLAPETTYYVRLLATNEKGTTEQTSINRGNVEEVDSFTTITARPVTTGLEFVNVTATSARLRGALVPHGTKTRWRFESAPSTHGPWTVVPGGTGVISQAEAEAEAGNEVRRMEGSLTGLGSARTYYVRLFAENAAGEGKNYYGEPILTGTRGIASFETTGSLTLETFAVHGLDSEAPRVVGAIDPESNVSDEEQRISIEGAPTGGTFTLSFGGRTTAPIAYDATERAVSEALDKLVAVFVSGPDGGPYNLFFGGAVAEPKVEADGAGLTPSGSVNVQVTTQGGEGYDAHYHFQYVSAKAFEAEGGFAGRGVSETPEVDVGSGVGSRMVAADLPGLTPGETYDYRILGTSNAPGDPVVYAAAQTLTAPAPPVSESSTACPNEALRAGLSANLPDCRGYEQLTPVYKNGARELFNYGAAVGAGVTVGEGGENVMLEDEAVNLGVGPATGQSPYFFSRQVGGGWQMTAASTQPETGVQRPLPQLLAPDLKSFAFRSSFFTSPGAESKDVEYKAGPPGGPYATVASVPVAQEGQGWVGASRDFSKLLLEVADHTLLGSATGTKQGNDLYEYAGGELRQVNVSGGVPGSPIGVCGANIVVGEEERGGVSSAHAVSASGARVFFEAVPGKSCSEAHELFMRENGESTVDIGRYRFIAANAEGSELLLEKQSGETNEVLLYQTETAALTRLFAFHQAISSVLVSRDLSAIYFVSAEPPEGAVGGIGGFGGLYRYDVAARKLEFIDTGDEIEPRETSPEGRYLYLEGKALGGIPGASSHAEGASGQVQVYRYDSAEGLLQCMSCASSFDPEPKLIATFGPVGGGGGVLQSRTGYPRQEFASANGDYVFFDSAAALLPADVDGEVAPIYGTPAETENPSYLFSVSSDVYEWRKPGVDGCAHLQGCLALITNGRGGFLNLFLGTDESGRDAFIYTNSRLGPRDIDSAGDIYDARVGGGEAPPPPRPVECEGDSCSSPPSAPNDATPSSLTFSGEGNVAQPSTGNPAAKPAKPEKKTKKKKTRKRVKKAKARMKGKAKKSAGLMNHRRSGR